MDINAFKNLGATAMGRVREGENDTAEAPATSKAGKALARIGDFFARFTQSGREAQAQQNQNIRTQFAQALTQAYGPSAQGIVEKLTSETSDSKPLMARDVRKLISSAETLNKIDTVRVEVPGFGERGISRSMVPLSVATAMSREDLQEAIQAKVVSGAEIVNQLRNGENLPAPSQKQVADVMWFLQMAAESKAGTSFKAGAMTLDDPGGRIKQFLDSSVEAYQRKSSHIGDFQALDGGAHRGIDMKHDGTANLDELLPNGRSTILYGGLGESTDLKMPTTMLFVKMESHGCRLAPPSKSIRDDDGPAGRPIRFFNDLKQSLGHTFSFLGGIGERASGNHAADSRKERVNSEFTNGYKAMLNTVPDSVKTMLDEGGPLTKSGGIRAMDSNAETLLMALDVIETGQQRDEEFEEINLLGDQPLVGEGGNQNERANQIADLLRNAFQNLGVPERTQALANIREATTGILNLIGDRYGDPASDIKLRIGNEVILNDMDLTF